MSVLKHYLNRQGENLKRIISLSLLIICFLGLEGTLHTVQAQWRSSDSPTETWRYNPLGATSKFGPILQSNTRYRWKWRITSSHPWPQSVGWSFGISATPQVTNQEHNLGSKDGEYAYQGKNGYLLHLDRYESWGESVSKVGDQIMVEYNTTSYRIKYYTKQAGESEFTPTGIAYSNLTYQGSSRVWRPAASVQCIGTCTLEFVEQSNGALVNAPPSSSSSSINITAHQVTILPEHIDYSDNKDSNSQDNEVQRLKINTLPSSGTLYLDANQNQEFDTGEAVAKDEIVDHAALSAGKLIWQPDQGQGVLTGSFSFEASDGIFWADLGGTLTMNVTLPNYPPTASNVDISGSLTSGSTLTASYTYNDEEDDPESGTTFQWYRADDDQGTGKEAISGSTESTYTVENNESGKYIMVEVTPKAGSGITTGSPTASSWEGPVPPPLVLSELQQPSGAAGTRVNIMGNGFDASAGDHTITFMSVDGGAGNQATPDALNGNILSTKVPAGLSAGNYRIKVERASDNHSYTSTSLFSVVDGGGSLLATNISLTGAAGGDGSWGDYDGDGDLDLLVVGQNNNSTPESTIYRNDGNGNFSAIGANLTGVFFGSAKWGDFDADGDLDFVLTGQDGGGLGGVTEIYENEGNDTFSAIGAGLPNLTYSSTDWGDYDGDGDLDLIITGNHFDGTSYVEKTEIYKNEGDGRFSAIDAGLRGVKNSSSKWGDYDGDGDLDLIITGLNGNDRLSIIYENEGNDNFSPINAGLTGLFRGEAAWGDFDGDGDLDLVISGQVDNGVGSIIYENEGNGTFTDVDANLDGVRYSSSDWADFDADGDLDLIITGYNSDSENKSTIYENEGDGSFLAIDAGVSDVQYGSTDWRDFDEDGDLDLIITGLDSGDQRISKIYENSTPNEAPVASNVTISGDLTIGQQHTGSYDYSDADGDPESGTTYQWYRADDNQGKNKSEITGATSQTYTPTSADNDKYISFEVTPNDGTVAGSANESGLVGPISPFAGGSGTEANPYQVMTAVQLDSVRNHLDSHFIQTGDIDLDVAPYNEGEGWEPVGRSLQPFTGNYDGGGYAIDGLYINTTDDYQGFFQQLEGDIHNLKLTNVDITAGSFVGALAYEANNASVSNIEVSGSVTGEAVVGGLFSSYVANSVQIITDITTTVTVTSTNSRAGGIAGQLEGDVDIRRVASDQEVSGRSAGGLFGLTANFTGSITDSYVNGEVSVAGAIAGGFIGQVARSSLEIRDSYSSATINSGGVGAGIIGYLDIKNDDESVKIHNTYVTGELNANTFKGGMIATITKTTSLVDFSGSFWDTDSLGDISSVGNGTITGTDGMGLRTTGMKRPDTYADAGWDFDTTWEMEDPYAGTISYPRLQVNPEEPIPGLRDEAVPEASNVTMSGNLTVGQQLTADYDYSDADGDPETGTTYHWYRADDVQGMNKSAISGATSPTYTLTEADGGKHIRFEVTPSDGYTEGDVVQSSWEGPVTTPPEIILSGNDQDISNGATETSTADHTDFGNISLADSTLVRTFSISNEGTEPLNLTGDPVVSISGTEAAEFTITQQPGISNVSGKGQATFEVQFDPSALGERTAQISIASNDEDESPYTFAISGTGINNPPEFVSSASQSYEEEQNGVLDLEATDGDGGAVDENITYSISGGTDQGQFTIADANTGAIKFQNAPDFENPTDGNTDNIYEVEVTADDAETSSNTTTQVLTVTVTNVNEPPVFASSSSQMIHENNGDPFLNVNATDGDGGSNDTDITYSIIGGTDQDQFSIDSSTGELSPQSAFDFENPTDADQNNEYVVEVEASDGAQTSSQSIAVTVANVNEFNPEITFGDGNSSGTFTIAENNTEVTIISATDQDAGSSLSYSLSGGSDSGLFSIDENSGALVFDAAPDAENAADNNRDNTYEVDIRVSDGENSSTQTLSISVDDANESAPSITSASSLSIDEQLANGSDVWQLSAIDADRDATLSYHITQNPDGDGDGDPAFAIDETSGQITVNDAEDLNREQNASVELDIEVSDGSKTAAQTLTVNLNDVNEFTPVVSAGQGFSVVEDAANGDRVGTLTGSDEDATGTLQSWAITAGNADGIFEIDAVTGEFSIADNTNLDFESTESYTLSVTVGDGSNTSDPQTVTIDITNVNDTAPIFGSAQSVSIDENSTGNVLDVNAQNGDGGETDAEISYRLSGTDSAPFSIDAASGALSLDQQLDFENPSDANGDNSYELQVTADDGVFTSTQNISVTISDTPPALADQTLGSVNETAPNGTVVGTLTSTADAATRFAITAGNTDGAFAIDNSGQLTVADAGVIDYESEAEFELSVEANDKSEGAGVTSTITVTISDVDESPTFISAPTASIAENNTSTILDVDANDGDGGNPDANVSYRIADGKGGGFFEIDSETGALSFAAAPDFEQPADRDTNGEYLVDVRVDDGNSTELQTLTITVTDVNDAPTVSSISDQSIKEDAATDALSFTIADADNAVADLSVSAQSDNPSLLRDANIALGGTGSDRTVALQPVEDASGLATITIAVDDGSASSSTSFDLEVQAVNDEPTISSIDDQAIREDESTGELAFTIGDTETDATNLDLSATSDDQTLLPDGNILLAGNGANRTVELTPAPNENGTASVTLELSDGTKSVTSIFEVTVNAVNDAPTITAIDDQTIAEDGTAGPIGFTVTDIDNERSELTFSARSSNQDLLADENIRLGGKGDDRRVSLQPAANQSGSASITITVDDGSAANQTSFELTVTPENDPPVISGTPSGTVDEDTEYSFTPSASDPEGDKLSFTIVNKPDWATFNPADGQLSGIPGNADVGTHEDIQITVSDGNGGLAKLAPFDLTVENVNDAPTVTAIEDQQISEDNSSGPLKFNITDVDDSVAGLMLTASSENQELVSGENITLDGSGKNRSLTVQPAPEKSGSVTITLQISDGDKSTATSFELMVTSENDAPTITAIEDQAIDEDDSVGPVEFTISDLDNSVDELSVQASSDNQALLPEDHIILGGTGENRTVALRPAADGYGATAITLTVDDGKSTSTKSFQMTVNSVNDAPVISGTPQTIVDEDAEYSFRPEASDIEDDKLTFSIINKPAWANFDAATGQLSGTPGNADVGTTQDVKISVSDEAGATAHLAAFDLTVANVNDGPTITAIANQTVQEDSTACPLAFSVGDADTELSKLKLEVESSNASLLPNANISLEGTGGDRTMTLQPAKNQNGTTKITLTLSDGDLTASSSFELSVQAIDDAPTITSIDDKSIDEDGSTGELSIRIGDVESSTDELMLSARSDNPVLLPDANISIEGEGAHRTLKAKPLANKNGTATITATVSEGQNSAETTFKLTVNPVNDAPTISAIEDQQVAEDAEMGPIDFSVDDIDNDLSELRLKVQSDNQKLVPDTVISLEGKGADRSISFAPLDNHNGLANITLTVDDGVAANSISFGLTVNAVNDPPVILGTPPGTVDEDTEYSFTPSASDPEGDELKFAIANKPNWATFSPADGQLSGTPGNADVGTYEDIQISVSDGNEGSVKLAAFDLTVENTNDAPVVDAGIGDQSATQNTEFSFAIPEDAFTDVDAGDTIMLSVMDLPETFSFDPQSRTISGMPTEANLGGNQVSVRATDAAGATASTSFDLSVAPEMPGKAVLDGPVDGAENVALSATVSWNPMASAKTFELEIGTSSDFEQNDIAVRVERKEDNSYTLTEALERGKTYYWRVRGLNYGATGEWSEIFSFTTIPEVPQKVTLSAPNDDSVNVSLRPELSWEANDASQSYEIELATDDTFESDVTQVKESGITASSYELQTDLDRATTYYWRARGVNSGGAGKWSEAFRFATIPTVPAKVVLTAPENSKADVSATPMLSWESAEGAAKYELRVAKTEDFANPVMSMKGSQTNVKIEQSLDLATTYYWQVLGINAGGKGQWSDVKNFTTVPAVPAKVVLASPSDSARSIDREATLEWQPAARAESYSIVIATDQNFNNLVSSADGIAELQFTSDEISDNMTYFWRVKARNSGGTGPWSDVRRFTTEALTPVLSFPAEEEQEISIAPRLSWVSDYEESRFRVKLSADRRFETIVADTLVDVESAKISGLDTDTQYFWQVRVETELTTSPWTAAKSFTTRMPPDDEDPVEEEITFGGTSGDGSDGGSGSDGTDLGSFDYRLVGLPGSAPTPVDELFNGDYGTDWKVFEDTGDEEDFLREHSDDNPLTFRAGRGYWVLSRKPVSIKGDIPSVEISDNDTYALELKPGWNIISNPFKRAANWQQVQEFNGYTTTLYDYDGSFSSSDKLEPFKAYYIYNDSGAEMTLEIPYTSLDKRGSERNKELFKNPIERKVHLSISGKKQKITSRLKLVYASDPGLRKEADRYHPPLKLSKFGATFIRERKHRRERMLRTLADSYSKEQNHYTVAVKSAVREVIRWKVTTEGFDNETGVLVVDAKEGRTKILQHGETYSFMTVDGRKNFDVYTGSMAELNDIKERLAPQQITLKQNYPNPFNPSTTIRFGLDKQDDVQLEVFDILGRKVRTLVNDTRAAGWYEISFDGRRLASGTYFYRLIIGQQIKTRKMLLIK